jgi:hypothetical protein
MPLNHIFSRMKTFKLFLLMAIVLFSACQSEQKQGQKQKDSVYNEVDTTIISSADTSTQKQNTTSLSNPNNILVTCDGVGKITISDTYADVVKKAGKANVTTDSVLVDGKFYNTYCTKVWQGTAGEITINWQESKQPYQTIQNLIIDNPNSTYVLENGLKIGSKLSLFNKLNGKPFSLYGFGNKNKGTVVSFNGGNLDAQISCIRPVFGMVVNANDFQNAELAAAETGILSSDHKSLQKVNPIVVKLIINSKH